MSAIIQETGGPLREERAVDGKLKSHLEWPNRLRVFSAAHALKRRELADREALIVRTPEAQRETSYRLHTVFG